MRAIVQSRFEVVTAEVMPMSSVAARGIVSRAIASSRRLFSVGA
jgi:hypothetical protein